MEITPASAPVTTDAAPAAPVSTPIVAPVVASAAVEAAPVVVADAPAVAEAPVPAPTVVEAEVKPEATILGTEKPVEQPTDKPAEVKPNTEGEKPKEAEAESSKSDEPAPLPTYEAFVIPEGVTLKDEQLGEFTKQLGEFESLTKADHAEVQKFGQQLVDKHIAEVQKTAQRVSDYYAQAWETQKNDWKESFINDPEIGGKRQETTVNAALEFIRTHGGNDVQQKEFRELMDKTGIGNHPAMIRLLASANTAQAEGKPLPAPKPVPQVQSKVAKRYGNKI